MEIDYYDSAGHALDYEKYDSLGGLRKDATSAIVIVNRDTIHLGEKIIVTGHLANNLYPVSMLIGEKYNEKGFVADTLAIVNPKAGKDGCVFVYQPKEKGEHNFVGYMQETLQTSEKKKDIYIFPFAVKYYVSE